MPSDFDHRKCPNCAGRTMRLCASSRIVLTAKTVTNGMFTIRGVCKRQSVRLRGAAEATNAGL